MRELQEMEKQIGDVELGEIQPDRGGTVGGREVSLGAGSFIATDSSKGKEEERKALLKRLAGAKVCHRSIHAHSYQAMRPSLFQCSGQLPRSSFPLMC